MHTHSLPSLQRTLVATMAILVVAGLFQNVIGATEVDNGSVGYLCVMLLVNGALGAFLFLRLIPRAIEAGPATAARRAVVMGGVAVVSVVAFWIGLPFTVGVAAIVLGNEARRRGGAGQATVAIALGILAVAAATAITILDSL